MPNRLKGRRHNQNFYKNEEIHYESSWYRSNCQEYYG